MRRPLVTIVCALFVALATISALLAPPVAQAGTRSLTDNSDFDVIHPHIDIDRLKVTYTRNVVRAEVRFFDLQKVRRLRFFAAFMNKEFPDDPLAPNYGNFVEMRIAPSGKKSVVNWTFDPESDGYQKRSCRGTQATPDYRNDVIRYVLPRRCFNFLKAKSYIRSYVSARKYTAAHWHGGDPVLSTGDWFDTTYELRTPR